MAIDSWAIPDRKAVAVFPPGGFLRDYIDYMSSCTDAPIIYHLGTILTSMALCAARADIKVYPLATPGVPSKGRYQKLSIVLWSVIVGRSGDRKSHAMKRGVTLARRACQVVKGRHKCILPSDGSTEGWTHFLADSPMGLFYRTELSSLLDQSRRGYQEGLKSWLMSLYEDEDFTRITLKDGEMVIERPRVSVLGAIPPATFKQKTNLGDWNSGYLARHLFFAGTREWRRDIPVTDDAIERKLADWLARVACKTCGFIVIPGPIMDLANDWMIQEIELLRRHVDDALYSHLERYQEQAYRIAAMFALSRQTSPQTAEDGEIEVIKEDMVLTLKALGLLKKAAISLYAHAHASQESMDEYDILTIMAQNPKGMTIRQIHEKIPRIPLRVLRQHLSDLEQVSMTRRQNGSPGAPAKIFKLT